MDSFSEKISSCKHLTDQALLQDTAIIVQSIRRDTVLLLELLYEINLRKLYCDLGHFSLFNYIVVELMFSASQAGLYCTITKNLSQNQDVKNLIHSGKLNLGAAHQVALIVKENKDKFIENKQVLDLALEFAPLSNLEAQKKADAIRGKTVQSSQKIFKPMNSSQINSNTSLIAKISKLKKKLILPPSMSDTAVFNFLLDEKLSEGLSVSSIKTDNKTITPKTRQVLFTKALHQCEYVASTGLRCSATRYLEVDHITPRALGGNNDVKNLRILCSAHNKKMAMNQMGNHIIHKRN